MLSLSLIAPVLAGLFAGPGATYSVHEWGTFTMVIDTDGKQLDWFRPLLTEPLPAFVHRGEFVKERCDYPVRMETPVLYFHTSERLVANVTVRFDEAVEGKMTEWFPMAIDTREQSALEWHDVRVDPQSTAPFPTELGGDHYYAARAAAAAPLGVDVGKGASENEKFLFYRGVARFSLPLKVTQDGSRVRIANEGSETCGHAFLYSRSKEQGSLVDLGELRPGAVSIVDRAAQKPTQRIDLLPLENALVAEGLFRDEAAAMISTWRNSWFEDGVRVLFTLPQKTTDRLLPLSITPPPERVERVMVGRYEIVTPAMREDIVALGEKLLRATPNDDALATLASRYGRTAFAVLARDAADIANEDPDRAAQRSQAAWSLAAFQVARQDERIGQHAEGN